MGRHLFALAVWYPDIAFFVRNLKYSCMNCILFQATSRDFVPHCLIETKLAPKFGKQISGVNYNRLAKTRQ